MSAYEIAVLTLIVAVVTLVAAVAVPIGLRHRDRIDLAITKIEDRGDAVFVTVRNRGGTPTSVHHIAFEGGTVWPAFGGYAPLPGRGEIRPETSIELLATHLPGGRSSIYVEDGQGNRSKLVPIPSVIVERVAEHRRITRG